MKRHWLMYWYGFWIRIAYLLKLRWPFISAQRRLKGENKAPRMALPTFDFPEELEAYAKVRFQYRRDETRVGGWVLPLDWVTDPEVFQARLESEQAQDGDCDDFHFWAATILKDMRDVERVYLLSSGYPKGGHTCCVYKYEGKWYLLDYRIREIDDPNTVPQLIAQLRTPPDKTVAVLFYVFERMDVLWRPAAICPNQKVEL